MIYLIIGLFCLSTLITVMVAFADDLEFREWFKLFFQINSIIGLLIASVYFIFSGIERLSK